MDKLCVIIPLYNEEKRFPVSTFLDFINKDPDTHFCMVNDGSTDNTITLLNSLASDYSERVFVVDKKINQGKAEAVRSGMLAMTDKDYKYFSYFDADFSTSLEELMRLRQVAVDSQLPFICGSRVRRLGASIDRSFARHYIGRIFATLTSLVLRLPIYDSQCGAKMIRKDIITTAFKDPFFTKWLFDVEIFARLINAYGHSYIRKNTMEVPLIGWEEKEGTKIKMSHGFQVPYQLVQIKIKYKI